MAVTVTYPKPKANGAIGEHVIHTTRTGVTVDADDPAAYYVTITEFDASGSPVFELHGITDAAAAEEAAP